MTNKELVRKMMEIEKARKDVYMWGVFGAPVTERLIVEKTRQYPGWYTGARQRHLRSLIGKGYFGFDCVNIIKGILWGWNGDLGHVHGGARYRTNGVPDINANGMNNRLNNKSKDFSKIGLGDILWVPGHVGVYIGDGKVVESTPRWENRTQITACLNIGAIQGLQGRTWEHYGELPYLTYVGTTDVTKEPTGDMIYRVVQGDTLSHIAGKFGVSVDDLVRWNNISNPNLIRIGQEIRIKVQEESYILYKVNRGDSLWRIAERFLGDGRRHKEIVTLNNLRSSTIHPGQELKIPKK